MPTGQINITLGTAGHIDHGKTVLVKCLTGCDTDRLKAEKERGMSIDLGFAPCRIGDLEVGIVDVPGHENFIRTMVAGAAGMDAVLLVVAADDGVMPQTREHMDILTLLGLDRGLVALTKIDRVAPEHLEFARDDVREFLNGTFLENAPVLPVSGVTGEGFDRFHAALVELLAAVRPKPVDGVFRVPVDRAFSAKGHGTVVTGIPVSGSARTDDEVVLLPAGLTGRIRGIEVYGRKGDVVMAGQCAALNVRHWDHRTIGRGDTLAAPGFFWPQQWFVLSLRLLPRQKVTLKNGTRVRFHAGTSEVSGAVYLMEGDRMGPGEQGIVQLRTSTPIVAGPGDHFILRMPSPAQTIGGGMIIEGTAKRLKRRRESTFADLQRRAEAVLDEKRFVEYAARTADSRIATAEELAKRTKVPYHRAREILAELVQDRRVIALGPNDFIHADTAREAADGLLQTVGEFHERSPESPGITHEGLRQSSRLEKAVVDAVAAMLQAEGRLADRSGRWAMPEHQATFGNDEAENLEKIETLFRQRPFHPPSVEELAEATGAAPQTVERVLRILREHQRLVAVEGLLFHQEAVERARQILVDSLRKEGRLESVRFKYLLDTTRKFAIPMLDHFDRIGVTRRVGNTRYLRTPAAAQE